MRACSPLPKNAETGMRSACVALTIALAVTLIQCSVIRRVDAPIVRISGSDTMLILTRLWAEEYMTRHGGVSVYTRGGGTATGAEHLVRGEADICAASRPLLPEEASRLARNFRTLGLSILVAKDALSVYLHPDNPVRSLTLEQVRDIYLGEIKEWSALGGRESSIRILNRMPNSGTYLYFKEHVLEGAAYSSTVETMPTTRRVIEVVAADPDAIGYGGIAYSERIFACPINGVAPTEENVIRDRYPLTRYLYFYTVNVPEGQVKDFIDWTLSPEGQEVVTRAGFFPIWSPE